MLTFHLFPSGLDGSCHDTLWKDMSQLSSEDELPSSSDSADSDDDDDLPVVDFTVKENVERKLLPWRPL